MEYLVRNQESLDSAQLKFVQTLGKSEQDAKSAAGEELLDDPVRKLQRMSMSELTRTYDFLLSILRQRETLIKQRLRDTLAHYGDQDRTLHESHDYSRELEHMPDILRSLARDRQGGIDTYLSVNEQIANMKLQKHMPPGAKQWDWLTGSKNYALDKSWNEE